MQTQPEQKKATLFLAVLIALSIILLIALIWVLPLGLVGSTILIGAAAFAIVLLVAASYKLYQLRSMRYTLTRNGLELAWGFRRVFIPTQNLTWARPVAEFKSALPLPALHLPGLVLGFRKVQGLGRVEYALTESRKAVLISGNGKVFAISPKQPTEFAAQVESFQQMGPSHTLPAVDESLAKLLSAIWSRKAYRTSLLLGLGLGLLCLALAAVFSSLYPSVTWVTLETVPSFQLFILPVLALGIWLLDLSSGIFLFHQNQVEKSLVHAIWIASAVVSTLLIIAMLLML